MADLKTTLNARSDLQKYLFCRGFLLTDQQVNNTSEYPFYSNWNHYEVRGYHLYVHNLQRVTINDEQGAPALIMVGHAYNPFTMEKDEEIILKRIAAADDRIDYINELTGVFFLAILTETD